MIWFRDLMQALSYVGIPCASVKWADPNFRQTWDSFRPNVFISIDIAGVIKGDDYSFKGGIISDINWDNHFGADHAISLRSDEGVGLSEDEILFSAVECIGADDDSQIDGI